MAEAGVPTSSVASPSSCSLKCRSLLRLRPRCSSLAFRLPRSWPQIVTRRCGAGYESTMSLIDVLSRTDGLVQTYNSLNQSPCKVAAYLQSTCGGGSECSPYMYKHSSLTFCSVYRGSPPRGIRVFRPERS